MTTVESLTNRELLLQIVSAERECSKLNSYPHSQKESGYRYKGFQCPELHCLGTGKVPILDPGLMRLPCPNQDGFWSEQFKAHCVSYLKGHSICTYCQGRNWLPNPDAWAMKKALHQAKLQLLENQGRSKDFQAGCFPQGHGKPLYPIGGYVWDADPERARLLAVAKAFGI